MSLDPADALSAVPLGGRTEPVDRTQPTVALLVTSYFFGSHADVLGTRMIEGYEWEGRTGVTRVRVASMYLEQPEGAPLRAHQELRPDIGVEIATNAGVPLFPTVGEAMTLGGSDGVAVDGVVIIGEHGDYEDNEYGQKLYPRRRLFDAAVATMVGAGGRKVPVFNDKHLGYSISDAMAMYETSRRLGFPLAAGSTIPLSWRHPQDAAWPLDEPMTGAVTVGYGGVESYGFHALEGHQAHLERRAGGETGVASVQALGGADAVAACRDGRIDSALLSQAFEALGLDEEASRRAIDGAAAVFLLTSSDGLDSAVLVTGAEVRQWATAARGPNAAMACEMWLPGASPGLPTEHFIFLARQAEHLVLTGQEPYPVERTVITTGVLDAAMRSLHDGGVRLQTPELAALTYRPADPIADTGVGRIYPEPCRPSEAAP